MQTVKPGERIRAAEVNELVESAAKSRVRTGPGMESRVTGAGTVTGLRKSQKDVLDHVGESFWAKIKADPVWVEGPAPFGRWRYQFEEVRRAKATAGGGEWAAVPSGENGLSGDAWNTAEVPNRAIKYIPVWAGQVVRMSGESYMDGTSTVDEYWFEAYTNQDLTPACEKITLTTSLGAHNVETWSVTNSALWGKGCIFWVVTNPYWSVTAKALVGRLRPASLDSGGRVVFVNEEGPEMIFAQGYPCSEVAP